MDTLGFDPLLSSLCASGTVSPRLLAWGGQSEALSLCSGRPIGDDVFLDLKGQSPACLLIPTLRPVCSALLCTLCQSACH